MRLPVCALTGAVLVSVADTILQRKIYRLPMRITLSLVMWICEGAGAYYEAKERYGIPQPRGYTKTSYLGAAGQMAILPQSPSAGGPDRKRAALPA
jgi:hypothetical protein